MARVLIVDENIEHLRTLQAAIAAAGHQVVIEDNGESALIRMQLSPFDVIVLDLVLPGLTGLELLRRLRAMGKLNPPPAVVVTALSSWAVGQLIDGPHDAFCVLTKPVSDEQLAETVNAALAHSGADRRDTRPLEIEADDPRRVSITFPSAERFLSDYMEGLVDQGITLAVDSGLSEGDDVDLRIIIPCEDEPCRVDVAATVEKSDAGNDLTLAFSDRDRAREALLAALAQARVDAAREQVRVHYGAGVRVLRGNVRLAATGINLGTQGVAVAMKVPIDHGRLVTVELPLPDGPAAVLAGKVIWTDWNRNSAMWWVGIEFMALPAKTKKRVRGVIAEALVECAAGLLDQVERRHVRIPVESPIALRIGRGTPKGFAVDLCEGGVGVALQEELEIGTECQLELTLPDGQSPLSERARVTWASVAPDGGWRHGLAFDDLSPAGEHRVRALVAGTA